MNNNKDQKQRSLVPSSKREIAEYSSGLISRGLELVRVVEAKQKSGLFPIKKGAKYGYIDRAGKIIIHPRFNWAGRFSEGLAVVKVADKYGYIDETGKIVIVPQFDDAWEFSERLAAVKVGDKWGYIDKTGKVIIDPQFDLVSGSIKGLGAFSQGLAAVKVGDKYGYIDQTGKIVINPQFDKVDLLSRFSEGLKPVKVGDKWGYIDKAGKVVIDPQFGHASEFSEGLAAVKVGNKWGYIDKTGKTVIDPQQFDGAMRFSEGLAGVKVGDKWGYIDKTGKMAIYPRFDSGRGYLEGLAGVHDFSEGLARVIVGDKYGYIDKTGTMVISPQFNDAWEFSEGLARVMVGEKWGHYYYIDNRGEFVWEPVNEISPNDTVSSDQIDNVLWMFDEPEELLLGDEQIGPITGSLPFRMVLASLTPIEEKIIRMRFAIGKPRNYSAEEIGEHFSMSRQRIYQIEAKALRKLCHPSRARKLKSCIEGQDLLNEIFKEVKMLYEMDIDVMDPQGLKVEEKEVLDKEEDEGDE